MRLRSVELPTHVGEQVTIAGWIHSIRRLAKVTFVVVRDGWGTVQIVVANPDRLAPLDGLELETVVEVTGTVVAEPQLELHGPSFAVISPVTQQGPILLSKKTLDIPLPTLLDHGGISARHPTRRAVFTLAAAAMRGFRHTLDALGFTEIQSPKLVGGATEGGANVFTVDYFGTPAYLAQSPQLYKQTMVGVYERVYEVGPVFRAEPHDTARHINQYVSLDVELGFIASHADVMAILVSVLRGMLGELATTCARELALLGATLPALPESVPELHFTDAQAMLGSTEPDLSPEDERTLGAWAREQHTSDFAFVVGYPMSKRPFYTHPDPARPAYSRSFDLLFRGTELVTGGQRLHRHADYLDALAARGMSAEPLASYLEVFANGMPPHGGFAIGLERFVMQLLGLSNIRLATLFPRDLTRLSP